MEQNASAALVTAIVAVVLGGAGLIGGVIGYVQAGAAVHRAGAARQRAAAAEEAALQARFAAEATARSAEELVARLQASGPPATGPVPTGTGPLPTPRFFTPAPLPSGSTMPAPTTGSGLLPSAAAPQQGQPGEAFRFPLGTGQRAATAPATPQDRLVPAPPTEDERPSQPAAAEVQGAAEPVDAGRPAEQQPAEAFTFPVSLDGGPAGAERDDASGAADPAPAQPAGDRGPHVVVARAQISSPVPDADPEPADAAALPPEPATQAEQDGATPDGAEPSSDAAPATDADQGAAQERGSRGQVVVGSRDAPPMDWAEVLRTGAIPLPSISRGTYAAPRRKPKPTGEGPARFELRLAGRQRFEAINVGGQVALEARIEGAGDDPHLVRPLSPRPETVAPGGTLPFSVLRVEGREAAAQVRWLQDGVETTQDLPLA